MNLLLHKFVPQACRASEEIAGHWAKASLQSEIGEKSVTSISLQGRLTVQLQGISKDQVEWSREDTVVSYSAITQGHVKVRGFGFNPHIVEEEEDDLEVVDEVAGADNDVVELGSEEDEGPGSPVSPDSMKRKRKAAKARRS